MEGNRRRGGYALILTVLLVLALSGISLGVLASATHEAAAAQAYERAERARLAAESAVGEALSRWSTRRFAAMVPGDEVVVIDTVDRSAGDHRTASVLRLARGLFMVRGQAGINGPADPVRARAAILVATLDPDSLAAGFPAAITADQAVRIEHGHVRSDSACGTVLPPVIAPLLQVGAGASVSGTGAWVPSAPPPPSGGALSLPMAAVVADMTVADARQGPRPGRSGSGCAPGSSNWGSADPVHPCHGVLPVVYAGSSLVLRSAEARGVIAVDGDLVVQGGRVHGVILARGTVTLEAGTAVHGAIRAARIRIRGATIAGDPCEVMAAVSAPALDRPFRAPDRSWIPEW